MADENRVQLGRVVPNYLGDWSSTKSYSKLDSVVYNSVGYIANKDVAAGVVPGTDSTSWRVTNRGAIGPKGDTGPQGPQGIQGPRGPQGERGKQIFKSSAEYYEPSSSGHWWSDLSPAVSLDNPPKVGDTIINSSGNIFQINTVNVGDGGGGGGTFGVGVVLGNITGPQGPKGDMDLSQITVGGRNYILNSSGLGSSSSNIPILSGGTGDSAAWVSLQADRIVVTNNQGSREFYYGLAKAWADITKTPLIAGNTYTLSVKVRGASQQVALRAGYQNTTPSESVSYTRLDVNKWTKATLTFTIPVSATTIFIRINGALNNKYTGFVGNETFEFKEVMLEQSNVASDWTPAPEDAPSNDAQLVHKTGNEVLVGDKTFTGNTTLATTTILAGNYGLRVTSSGFQKTTDGRTWVSANI